MPLAITYIKFSLESRRWRDGSLPNTALQGTLRDKAAQRP